MLQQEPYSVHEGQNLFDVSTMEYGDSFNALQLAYENNLSLTDNLFAGQKIKPIDTKPNLQVLQVYRQTNIIAATGFNTNQPTILARRGIGYMQIGSTFKVS